MRSRIDQAVDPSDINSESDRPGADGSEDRMKKRLDSGLVWSGLVLRAQVTLWGEVVDVLDRLVGAFWSGGRGGKARRNLGPIGTNEGWGWEGVDPMEQRRDCVSA